MNAIQTARLQAAIEAQQGIFCEYAVLGIRDEEFEDDPTFCQRYVREIAQEVYGHTYDELWKSNAIESAKAVLNSRFYRHPNTGTLPGDICYKTRGSGPDGHVGIRVWGNFIAENSSYHSRRNNGDARGLRTVQEFGAIQIVCRLPYASHLTLKTLATINPQRAKEIAEDIKRKRGGGQLQLW